MRANISANILIFLQILFSKYFKYINSEFDYIFSFSICLFRRKCQGLQFCKNVCKLEIPCNFFSFNAFIKLSRHRTFYLRVHLGHFGHICQIGGHRTHPNVHRGFCGGWVQKCYWFLKIWAYNGKFGHLSSKETNNFEELNYQDRGEVFLAKMHFNWIGYKIRCSREALSVTPLQVQGHNSVRYHGV